MRVLSGIQPSGKLHLGNYFGSIVPNLELSKSADESYFFVADLHALTSIQDPEILREARKNIVLDYLACGFDPEKTVMYYQSTIPEHTDLMWILLTLTPMGLLERAVSYKDKVEKGASPSAGLFTYPVLMAADILLYQADKVPVGKDQKQHLEMTRDIAMKFNNTYGETFILPEPIIQEHVAVVPGVDGQKMSKSYGNTISIFGDEKEIKKAIMGIVTDSKDVKAAKDPDTSTVYKLHSLFLNESKRKDLHEEYKEGGIGYGDFKKKLFETFMDHFKPLREKRESLQKSPKIADAVMENGTKVARETAKSTLERVYKAVGL